MYRRYHVLENLTPTSRYSKTGEDFWDFLHAARQIAAGHSPYNFALIHQGSGYVYSPLVALALLPFHAAATVQVWHAWTVCSIFALVLFGALVTMVEAPSLSAWRRPLLFGFTALTILPFGPTVLDLSLGQTDGFVLVLLAAAVLVSERGWAAATGVHIGLGAVIKTWPGGVALTLLRHNYVGRGRAVAGFVITLLLGPLLALALGGGSEFVDFLRITFDARLQQQVSYSVWGAPRLLFSSSGLAHPVIVSAPLRDIATLVLALWVLGLLVIILRRGKSPVISFWNVVACVVLLLPVSHLDYALYLLPILWIWAARTLAAPRLLTRTFIVAGLLLLWWLVLFRTYWDGLPTLSSWHPALPFFANLAAVTISVIGDQFVWAHSTRVTHTISSTT
jgi:hypothetical protein